MNIDESDLLKKDDYLILLPKISLQWENKMKRPFIGTMTDHPELVCVYRIMPSELMDVFENVRCGRALTSGVLSGWKEIILIESIRNNIMPVLVKYGIVVGDSNARFGFSTRYSSLKIEQDFRGEVDVKVKEVQLIAERMRLQHSKLNFILDKTALYLSENDTEELYHRLKNLVDEFFIRSTDMGERKMRLSIMATHF